MKIFVCAAIGIYEAGEQSVQGIVINTSASLLINSLSKHVPVRLWAEYYREYCLHFTRASTSSEKENTDKRVVECDNWRGGEAQASRAIKFK